MTFFSFLNTGFLSLYFFALALLHFFAFKSSSSFVVSSVSYLRVKYLDSYLHFFLD